MLLHGWAGGFHPRRMTHVLTRRTLGKAALPFACALAAPRGTRAAPAAVRVGYQKMGALVILRQQPDRLALLGAPVEWVEFSSGPPMLEALNAGAVDFAAVGDTPPLFAQAAGADLLYVGGQPLSGTAEGVLVADASPIRSVPDLRGKRLAFTKGSSAHATVVRLLAAAGLAPSDVERVYLQPPDAAAAFRSGALDAWAVWDPFFAVGQLEPGARVLATAAALPQTSNFFMASRRFATERAPLLLGLLDAVNGVAEWAAANPDALVQAMAAVTGVPLPAQRLAALRGTYAVQAMDDAIVARQQSLADDFARLRIIPARVDVRAIVWTPPRQVTGASQ